MSEGLRARERFGSVAVLVYSRRKLEQFGENGGGEVAHRGAVRGLIRTMANTPYRARSGSGSEARSLTRTATPQLHNTWIRTWGKFGSGSRTQGKCVTRS